MSMRGHINFTAQTQKRLLILKTINKFNSLDSKFPYMSQ